MLTNVQFDGPIEYVGVWKKDIALSGFQALHTGTYPTEVEPDDLVFLMVLGYQTPDVDLVGGTIQSTITGSLPFVEGPTGLPIDANYAPTLPVSRFWVAGVASYKEVEQTPAPEINSVLEAQGTVGVPFHYEATATNGPFRFIANGLPEGWVIDEAEGFIDETPTEAGTFAVRLAGENETGIGPEATLVLTIDDVVLPPPAGVLKRKPLSTALVIAMNNAAGVGGQGWRR